MFDEVFLSDDKYLLKIIFKQILHILFIKLTVLKTLYFTLLFQKKAENDTSKNQSSARTLVSQN